MCGNVIVKVKINMNLLPTYKDRGMLLDKFKNYKLVTSSILQELKMKQNVIGLIQDYYRFTSASQDIKVRML